MRLICMAFDGDFVWEGGIFENAEAACEHSCDAGSRWCFYPFHVVVTDSGITVREAGEMLEFLNGWRVKKVVEFFKRVAALPEAQGANIDEFINLLHENA